MMNVLSIEYDALKSHINNLLRQCLKLEKNAEKILETTSDLDIFWDGKANEDFIVAINTDIAWMECLILKIRENIRLANDALVDYQDMEQEINQIIGELRL